MKRSEKEMFASFLFCFSEYLLNLSLQEARNLSEQLRVSFQNDSGSNALVFRPNKSVEFFRKIMLRLGFCHDVISLTQNEVVGRILDIRKKTAIQMKLNLPAEGCHFLLRVDDFPSFFEKSDAFSVFHEILSTHRIPYLLAITPYLHEKGLSSSEIAMLQKAHAEGMEPALHGFTHKSLSPRLASELLGMSETQLRESLLRAVRDLNELSLKPSFFVAPFNSYDSQTVSVLAENFPVLCGGPESVHSLGYVGPIYIKESLYLPSYRGAYDVKNDLSWIKKMKSEGHGLTIPIALHWANEAKDNFSNFKLLCEVIKDRMIPWAELLERGKRVAALVEESCHE